MTDPSSLPAFGTAHSHRPSMDIMPHSVLHGARTFAAPLDRRSEAMVEWTAIAAMKASFPKAFPGMRVGLLGGSFDPAHEGHAHVTREALKRLGLDRVWWLVSPGNPLKPDPPAPIAERMARARVVMAHPRVVITDIEARFGTRYTAKTLEKLLAQYPGVRFVWLMGADNLAQFHRWQKWDWIFTHVPIAVFARPGTRLAARGGRAAEEYARFRVPAEAARLVAGMPAPAWCFLDMPLNDLSSSAIRASGDWKGGKWRG